MNDEKCCFDKGKNYCSALIEKKCGSCKFKKTEKEFFDGLTHANEILEQKGLITFEHIGHDGKNCMGVRKIQNF